MNQQKVKLKHVIPKSGMVYSQKNEFQEIMCKPKLIPLKSMNLVKLEQMEKELMTQTNPAGQNARITRG